MAWNLLFNVAKLARGETVLVMGAGGNLGTTGIQLAKHVVGAKVIAGGTNLLDLMKLEMVTTRFSAGSLAYAPEPVGVSSPTRTSELDPSFFLT